MHAILVQKLHYVLMIKRIQLDVQKDFRKICNVEMARIYVRKNYMCQLKYSQGISKFFRERPPEL